MENLFWFGLLKKWTPHSLYRHTRTAIIKPLRTHRFWIHGSLFNGYWRTFWVVVDSFCFLILFVSSDSYVVSNYFQVECVARRIFYIRVDYGLFWCYVIDGYKKDWNSASRSFSRKLFIVSSTYVYFHIRVYESWSFSIVLYSIQPKPRNVMLNKIRKHI